MEIDPAIKYARSHQKDFVSDLKSLTRIPSVGFPGFDPKHVVRSAKAVAKLMKTRGLENVKVLKLPGGHPYVYGDWLHAKGTPTLLLYAHHDVQPPGRSELWKSPPFVPTERGGRLYGRGAADDKAGVVLHTSAVASYLKTLGRLPLNVKVLIEGEEECGSPSLERFLKKYARMVKADAMILSDTGNFDTGVPSITTSLRGIVAFDVTVRSMDHPLHSGMWGGPLVDPVQALAKMIAAMTDDRGELKIPGIHSEVRKPSKVEARSLKSLRFTEKDFRKQTGLLPTTAVLSKGGLLAKIWRKPAFSVNAIQASSREEVSNIINESAWCHMGMRIVPNMDPARTFRKMKAHLSKNAPWGVKVEISNVLLAPAWTTKPENPAFKKAAVALGKGFGRKAVFIGCGGSIPFVEPFSKALGGVPALLVGVEDPYCNPHSENESVHLGDLAKSIRSEIHLYNELARGF